MKCNPKYYTLDKIPEYRQQFIQIRLKQFLNDYRYTKVPVDSVKLVKEINKKYYLPVYYKQVPNMSNKFDAQARYYSKYGVFIILINKSKAKNNYPFVRSRDRRLNFTLAHEIAHIYLKHLTIPNYLKSPYQKELEDIEADEFAGRLLMPENLVLSCNFISQKNVAEKFNVSEQAIWKRINQLKRLDILSTKAVYVCEQCGNQNISPIAEYCKICGQSIDNHNKGVITVKYEGYELDEDGHAIKCPLCGNEDYCSPKEENGGYNSYKMPAIYCRICNSIVVNQCTNQNCEEIAEGNARYCEYCGSETTFFQQGHLPSWDDETQDGWNAHTDDWAELSKTTDNEIDLESEEDNEIPF